MNFILWIAAAISVGLWCTADAFVGESATRPTSHSSGRAHTFVPRYQTHQSSAGLLVLHASTEGGKKEKKSGAARLDENVKNRLVKETIAPWRPLRLFLYFALGSGAMIGGLITLSGTLAAMSGARPDVDLNAEVRSEEADADDVTANVGNVRRLGLATGHGDGLHTCKKLRRHTLLTSRCYQSTDFAFLTLLLHV
jgi:Low psii accumulation1 / Rep27